MDHFLSADRAEGFPHTGIEQPQVFVYFGGGAHGGPRIAATNFLLDGNGRRDAFDEIAFGLAHASQELAGVTAQALHVAALPLGIIIELATLGLTTIWFAAGAFAAFIAAALDLALWIQIGLFIIVSLVLLFCTRPLAVKYLNAKTSKTNLDSLIGKSARVTKTIDNIQAQGQAKVNGMEWTARSADDDVVIPEGTVVTILKISGVKLIVEEKKEGKEDE